MQTVLALIAPTKTAFANFDDVTALGRRDHRTETILLQKDRVIARGDLEAIRIVDRNVRIEEVVQVGMPQPFEFDVQALACFELNRVIIDIFIENHSVDRRVDSDLLSLGKFAIRLGLGQSWQGRNTKEPQVACTACCDDSKGMQLGLGIGRCGDSDLDVVVVNFGNVARSQSGGVKEQLAGIAKASPGDLNLDGLAPLHSDDRQCVGLGL